MDLDGNAVAGLGLLTVESVGLRPRLWRDTTFRVSQTQHPSVVVWRSPR